MLLGRKIIGGSTIMETIAVKATLLEEKESSSKKSYLNAFRRFLKFICDIQSIAIVFQETVGPNALEFLVVNSANGYQNFLDDVSREEKP